ncbi:MAG: hypothetical protein ACRCZG_01060 [Culicoidibacterales bacterium]
MQYINEDKQHHLAPHVKNLINALRELESDDPSNDHNENVRHVVAQIVQGTYERCDEITQAIGVLECCKFDLYQQNLDTVSAKKSC